MTLLALAIATGSIPGMLATTEHRAHAAVESWKTIGHAGISEGIAIYTSLFVDNGTPYVAYTDYGHGYKAKVKKFNGTEWEMLGSSGPSIKEGFFTSLAVYGGNPYVAFADDEVGYKATVRMYNGSSWETVGNAGFSAGSAEYLSLYMDHGTLYVAYEDFANSYKATVMKFNGSSWETVGSAGFSAGRVYDTSLHVNNGIPYVAYRDAANGFGITVMKFDGSGWQPVGEAGFTPYSAEYPSLYVDNGVPYIAYKDNYHDFKATVSKYNGSVWETVGNAGFSAGQAKNTSLKVSNGIPYVAYVDDGNGGRVTVMRFNGSGWEAAGNAGIGANPNLGNSYEYTSLFIDNGTPYVAFKDGANSNRMTVMKMATGYKVVYHGNGHTGGSVPVDGSVYDSGSVAEVRGNVGGLVRTGHVFGGWNTAQNGSGTSYSAGYPVTVGAADVTLYAQWIPIPYSVDYAGNGHTGGSVPPGGSAVYGATVMVQGNTGGLVRTGHSFTGWNTAANGSGANYAAGDAYTMGAGSVTFFAKWAADNYPVAYDGNGHTGGEVPAGGSRDYGTVVAVSGNSGGLVKTGHTFAGWNTKADGTGTSYNEANTFTMGTEGVTLYAQWSVNDYEVSYDGNGSDGGTVPAGGAFPYGTNVTVNGNTGSLFKTGHTFAGWNTKADGSGAGYAAQNVFPLGAEDVTLYAQWTANSYAVSFESNGGSEVDDQIVVYGHPAAVPVEPTKAGHTFRGWHSDESLQTPYAFETPIGAEDLTLYAKWTINSYLASFESNGGSLVTEQSVVFGQIVPEPAEPVKPGHTFAGWYSDESMQTPYAFGTPIGAGDLTLYAKWDINSYTLAYDGNGSTGGSVPAAGVYDYNEQVTLPGNEGGLTKPGHTFADWNTAADGSGTVYAAGDSLTIGTEGVTLYAQWTVNSYSISYDGNGSTAGSVPAGGVYDYGTGILVPDNTGGLDKPGYTFAGWNAAADGSGTAYRPGETFPMGDGALTLYAQWLSNNALLSLLSVDSSVQVPAFSPSILNYEVRLDYATTGIGLSFSQADPTQSVSVTGAVYQSVAGAVYRYQASDLPTGSNPIRIGVTAQDGTVNAYIVNVIREAGNVADLSGLALSAGALSPAFVPGTTAYSANVPNGVSSLAVTADASDPLALITVNGHPVSSGQPGAEIPLTVGSNPITVEVTAQDGTKKTYVVTVYRASSGGSGGGPALPPAGDAVSDNGHITIPARREGEVSLNGAITITVPSGASEQELKIAITEKQGARLPSGSVPLGPVLWIASDPAAALLKPATLSISFDPAKLKVGQEAAAFVYDEATDAWTELKGGKVTGSRISVEVLRLLPVAVLAVDRGGEPNPVTKPVPPFSDIAGHWAEAKIRTAVAAGIAAGYADGTFKPNRTVTRAEFAVLLTQALKLQGTEDAPPEFSDSEKIGAWARQSVVLAAQAGILKGYKDGTFRPNAEITRAEMAAMIASAMGETLEPLAATRFADDKQIPQWAKAAVNAVQGAGLIQGKGSGVFDAQGKTTRAEAVAVLLNLLEWQR
ncbi:InlB B-repeat-containing protein [Cohnella sp.]|uniref:InlB B-repeat-containing protein n=1 Tax=Cohnella sp. TaxID=1883426 RepID=UPI0035640F3D